MRAIQVLPEEILQAASERSPRYETAPFEEAVRFAFEQESDTRKGGGRLELDESDPPAKQIVTRLRRAAKIALPQPRRVKRVKPKGKKEFDPFIVDFVLELPSAPRAPRAPGTNGTGRRPGRPRKNPAPETASISSPLINALRRA